MTLQKISFYNCVRYVSKDDYSHSERALLISKERISNQNRRKKNASYNEVSETNAKIS